ncbi:hypothetical protein HYPSUDRAFT_207198 [Hypholoma sublateritium FD-334 SS-4]|uniref:Uncharacterized protein n=1 Tax=Hypholoma sublateritium (strain FD-334 SS-4) TaxID=945553 RepID=A0A0D2KNR6_HYPSF|nr:hypothetical protein HYPSUDRAFT_207198 [Hypholoma sublateritium FD-334 SS-4]
MSNQDDLVTLTENDMQAISTACQQDPINIICVGVLTGFFDMKDIITLSGLSIAEILKSAELEQAPEKTQLSPTVQHESYHRLEGGGSNLKRKFVVSDHLRASSETTPEPPVKRPRLGQRIYCRWGASQHATPCGFSFGLTIDNTAFVDHLEDVHHTVSSGWELQV